MPRSRASWAAASTGATCAETDASVATELLVGPVYLRMMFGGQLDRGFAERVVDSYLDGNGVTVRDVDWF